MRTDDEHLSRNELPTVDTTRRLGSLFLEGASGRLLAEGDMFQGNKISKITRDFIVLQSNGIPQELRLNDTGIPMIYENDRN